MSDNEQVASEPKAFERKYGTRSEVWEGTAMQTRGKLQKADLIMSRGGRIVSKRKSELAKKSYAEYGFKKRRSVAPERELPQPEKKPRKRRKKKQV